MCLLIEYIKISLCKVGGGGGGCYRVSKQSNKDSDNKDSDAYHYENTPIQIY